MSAKTPHRHPLVFIAFVLAILVFIMPTQADLMFAAWASQSALPMFLATVICFPVVLLPLIAGRALTRRHPDRWCKSKLATATWVLLAFGAFCNCAGWIQLATAPPPGVNATQQER